MKKTILSGIICLVLSSCASLPVKENPAPPMSPLPHLPQEIEGLQEVARSDVIHEVAPGETVWRISQMYDVPIHDIATANNLTDITKLEKGQLLLIPNAASLRSIIPLYPTNMWEYIIIHHSATDVGNALTFDYTHTKKRNWQGLGYHFVIDNGTYGKKDGHIEISPRWIRQEYGAHCKADGMNYKGIGICLVGNFNNESVSSAQLDSLVYLVNILKKYYNIPDSHILGHGQVKGAITDCPGKNFPWKEFRTRIK